LRPPIRFALGRIGCYRYESWRDVKARDPIFLSLSRLSTPPLPSIPGFFYFGWAALRMRMLTPAPSTAAVANADSVIGLIETGARLFGSVFRMLGAAGEWLTVIAAVFFLALLLAGGLFLTGRGIQA